jgi:hypothetical protein
VSTPDEQHPSTREHFRVQYPTAARPKVVLEGLTYDVVDLSEGGIKFSVGKHPLLPVNKEFSATVRFQRGEVIDITGRVLRTADRHVAARLSSGIPFKVILEEQRYLRERYPNLLW